MGNIKKQPEIQKFVQWVAKKAREFMDKKLQQIAAAGKQNTKKSIIINL